MFLTQYEIVSAQLLGNLAKEEATNICTFEVQSSAYL